MRKDYVHVLAAISCIVLSVFLSSCIGSNARPAEKQNIIINNDLKIIFRQSLKHLQVEEYDDAISLLETFTTKEKRLTAPYVNLGIAYSRTGMTKQAEQSFIAALRLDIGHAVANNELGLLYRKTGRFGAARSVYQNAITMHPDYLPVRKNLGILCEIYLHDLTCAIEQYRAYIEYKPDEKIIATWVLELQQRLSLKQNLSNGG